MNMTRVRVWLYQKQDDPFGEGYLGEGEFVGHVSMSEVQTREEAMEQVMRYFYGTDNISDLPVKARTQLNEIFSEEKYAKRTTPKIVLDKECAELGKVVYGCQVWWEPV